MTAEHPPARDDAGEDTRVATSVDARADQNPEPDQRLLRALADLDNLRKRYGRELDRERDAERRRVASEWLPIVDALERALDHADVDAGALRVGVQAIYEHALSVLERMGFGRFEDLGELFNPLRHEAVGTIQSDAPAGTVAAATRAGYGKDDDVLRPATVIVSQGKI